MIEPLLLDTHCWVWLSLGLNKKFSTPGRQAIERALRRDTCLLSVVSVWEVGVLFSKKRIHIKLSPEEWVDQALDIPGLTLIPLSKEAALGASSLPSNFHPDPADRLLVATARDLGARIVTADERILSYRNHVNVLQC